MGTSDDLLRMLNPATRPGLPEPVTPVAPLQKQPFEHQSFDQLLAEFEKPNADPSNEPAGTPVANKTPTTNPTHTLDVSRIENASLLQLIAQTTPTNPAATAQPQNPTPAT